MDRFPGFKSQVVAIKGQGYSQDGCRLYWSVVFVQQHACGKNGGIFDMGEEITKQNKTKQKCVATRERGLISNQNPNKVSYDFGGV